MPGMSPCSSSYSLMTTLGAAIAVTFFYLYTAVLESNQQLRSTSPKQEHEPDDYQKLAIGIAVNSCSEGDQTAINTADAKARVATDSEISASRGVCDDQANSRGRPADAAIEKTERGEERLGLVLLEPGQHVGPYRLQEHLGYLGSRPVHDYDPAFHPYEDKRVGYHPLGMISPPPRKPPVCPLPTDGLPHRPGQHDGRGGEGMVLKGGKETHAGEGSYRLRGRFEGGTHGEVWRGVRLGPDGEPSSTEGYVLKRMLLEKGHHVMQAGIREIYFGELLTGRRGTPRVARYVEHLYLFGDYGRGRFGRAGEEEAGGGGGEWEKGDVPTEMWLVFRDEGVSLRHYLYTEREAEGFVLHGQSNFWRDMRLDPKGPEVMKSILRQMLEGARFLHQRGILHRDLKPSNLIVSLPSTVAPVPPSGDASSSTTAGDTGHSSSSPETTPVTAGMGWRWGRETSRRRRGGGERGARDAGGVGGEQRASSSPSPPVLLRISDFSSAVDEGAMAAGLYGATGPAQGEETLQYAPPEVLFDPKTAYFAKRPESYDAWSIGVILLELILGTPEVFTVDQRTRAILDRDLAFEDDAVRAKAHLLAAMADMCIYSRSGHLSGTDNPGGQTAGRPYGARSYDYRGDAMGHSEGLHWPLGDRAVVDERCTLAELGKAVHTRDALDIGFPDQWGLDLLWRLLRWDPLERISMADALEHAYFMGPYRSLRDGSAHGTRREAMAYDGWFTGSARVSPTALSPRTPSPYAALLGVPVGREGLYGKVGVPEGRLVPASASGRAPAEHLFTLDNQHTLDFRYACPKCNRTFELWKSCHNHVKGRGHSSFCQYDTSSLPPCVSSHSMLPFDPHSGWCDVQGRRSRIEDYHSIVFQEDYKFYGVFDGHCGTRAAKFASRALHLNLELFLNAQESNELARPYRHASIERAVRDAFRKTQRDFLDLLQVSGGSAGHTPSGSTTAHGTAGHRPEASATEPAHAADYTDDVRRKNAANSSPAVSAVTDSGAGGEAGATVPGATAATAAATADDDSGTTATVALVYPDVTVVAHVGDSRAVMCCDDSGLAVEITEDHTPYSASERARVETNGGSVEHRGVLRVNGELAVTRTIGNRRLSRDGVLSSEPDVVFVAHRDGGEAEASSCERPEQRRGDPSRVPQEGQDGSQGGSADSCCGINSVAFLVLASDGLWDVVSSQEAVDMVKEVILGASHGHPAADKGIGASRTVGGDGSGADEGDKGNPRVGVARSYGLYGPGQAFQVAATALTHEAYVRGSTDNIGVCVVDLRPH